LKLTGSSNPKYIPVKRFLFIALPLFACSASFAQDYKSIRWEEKPKIHEIISEDHKKGSAVIILDSRFIEIAEAGKALFVYRTIHRIVRLLDDKGIEGFNKMSIAAGGDRSIEQIKARTILPDGREIVVGQDKIRETKNEEGGKEFVFAMEGVEKNAEVEILYTEKRELSLFGTETFQFSIPVQTAEFKLITPDRFTFETRGYNGFPTTTDTTISTKNIYHAIAYSIPGVEDESYSNYSANVMRIDYRLSYMQDDNPNARLFTWNDMAKRLHNGFYIFPDREKKVIRKYLKSLGVNMSGSELQKIRAIEDGIKSTISISQNITDESYNKFDKMIEKKLATEEGLTRLVAACLREAGANFEIGMTTNRFNYAFDEKFENWRLLEFYIFYFPGQKMFLSPASLFYRMPMIPVAAFGNKGVFSKVSSTGEATSVKAEIISIPHIPFDSSGSDIDATISFTSDMTPAVDITHFFRGCSALGLREGFVYVPKEKEKELVQQLIGLASTPEDITAYNVENISFTSYYENKPLKIHATLQSPGLMEKAGQKYLFKVGDVIGRQDEMYQEKQRRLPIDIPFPHMLARTITINIPDGYKVINPEAVRIHVDGRNTEGKLTMGFISDYKTDGAKLIITINEFYEQLNYPISQIETFKSVINAAADFNKVVLVLQKT
jgi:hypothetical protein